MSENIESSACENVHHNAPNRVESGLISSLILMALGAASWTVVICVMVWLFGLDWISPRIVQPVVGLSLVVAVLVFVEMLVLQLVDARERS